MFYPLIIVVTDCLTNENLCCYQVLFNFLSLIMLLSDIFMLCKSMAVTFDFVNDIRKTCTCNVYPLEPHFYIEKNWGLKGCT